MTGATVWYHLKKNDIDRRDRLTESKRKRRVEHANFYTNSKGYERWSCSDTEGGMEICYVARLAAVAEFGFEEVCGKEVHHKNRIPWDNRLCNLEPVKKGKHRDIHADEQPDNWENAYTPYRDKDTLHQLYVKEGRSTAEIGDMLNCAASTVNRWLKNHDIELRGAHP